jgi:DNA-binding transcriptional LysR family regulator
LRLDLDSLAVLDAIDRRGSFAAAADELDRVPSAITYIVRKLEGDLDVLLFDRSGHRAKFTAAGRELLAEGRHLLQAATELENRVRRVATGWETELRIAVDGVVPIMRLYPLLKAFYRETSGTRVRLSHEILHGAWDALVSGRADLAIAPGDGPGGGGYATRAIGSVEFVFAVATDHPLAKLPQPLKSADIQRHRAIVVADTSRGLPARTVGLLSGQDTLTVPDLTAKLEAQIQGMGVGFLPLTVAAPAIKAGQLVVMAVEETRLEGLLHLVWRPDGAGRALRWFLKEFEDARLYAKLLRA